MIMTENKQGRLRHYIVASKRFLRRARDFYIDSLVNFDDKVSSANLVACPATPSLSHLGYVSTKLDDDKNLQELYRSISEKYNWRSVEFDKRERVNRYGGMDRSYSIALGKIGRIDEEEQCDFEEHVVMKSEMMFPRCRSHAVTRNNGFY